MKIKELFEGKMKSGDLLKRAKASYEQQQAALHNANAEVLTQAIIKKLLEFKLKLKNNPKLDINGIYWIMDLIPIDIINQIPASKQYSIELTTKHPKTLVTHKRGVKGISINTESLIALTANSQEFRKMEATIEKIVKGM